MKPVGIETTTTKNTDNYQVVAVAQLTPEDQTQIYRLVGFYEYTNALQRFEKLLANISETERDTIDDIIKEMDELAIYVNLSRRMEPARTTLSETAQAKDQIDTFERRGLAWMMALARVELGAMFAGFSHIESPFESVRPTQFEMEAYRELLLDGLRTHYFALLQDPKFPDVIKKSRYEPGTDTLAYVRRLRVALAFFDAVGLAGQGLLNQAQMNQLSIWYHELDGFRTGLSRNIAAVLEPIVLGNTQVTSESSKSFTEFEKECLARCKSYFPKGQVSKYKTPTAPPPAAP